MKSGWNPTYLKLNDAKEPRLGRFMRITGLEGSHVMWVLLLLSWRSYGQLIWARRRMGVGFRAGATRGRLWIGGSISPQRHMEINSMWSDLKGHSEFTLIEPVNNGQSHFQESNICVDWLVSYALVSSNRGLSSLMIMLPDWTRISPLWWHCRHQCTRVLAPYFAPQKIKMIQDLS